MTKWKRENDDIRLEKIIKNLHCSKEEALEVLNYDKAIDRGEVTQFDPTPEEKKVIKAMTNVTGRAKTTNSTPRKRKENPIKNELIQYLYESLNKKDSCVNIQIVNVSRQISFQVNDNNFELTLIQKKK